MRGQHRAPIRHFTSAAITGGLLLAMLPVGSAAAESPPGQLPACVDEAATVPNDGAVVRPWRAVLDEDGSVVEHRLTLRRGGSEHTVRTGRRGFSLPISDDRILVGERSRKGTRLDLIDTRGGCRLWSRHLGQAAYLERDRGGAGPIRLSLHDPVNRQYESTLLIDSETGASEAAVEVACLDSCLPNDGQLSLAALQPAGAARPTPNFPAGGWGKDKQLTFRWKASAMPPAWARGPLKGAAEDAWRSAAARSPRFVYGANGANAVAYTNALPAFCSGRAIACARRDIPSSWGVWVRPHGTDFAWGPLRWCQKTGATSSCFDIRRVMLHELGHITGLDHPSSAGFTLSTSDSIMQGITPARPQAGASRHSFARCDVATLQELYDTTDNKTAISTCNDVATRLSLWTSRSTVRRGTAVKLTAQLTIDGRTAYRQLAGNPLNGRSLMLKYRRAGSGQAWKTAWMQSLYSGGRYVLTMAPGATWEFKAVFATPQGEGLRYSRSDIRRVKVRK